MGPRRNGGARLVLASSMIAALMAAMTAAPAAAAPGRSSSKAVSRHAVNGSVAVRAYHPRLTTHAAIARYLRSLGVNPRTAVWQRGARNYAGPSCPGAAWNCAAATPNRAVVQQAAASPNGGGQNSFQCSASPTATSTADTSGSDTTHQSCVIVQTAPASGSNTATCIENASNSGQPALFQTCSITQANTTGTNKAVVKQGITQRAGDTQEAYQHADVTQTNDSGDNIATITQDVDQDTQPHGGATQDQEAFQDITPQQGSSSPTGLYQVSNTGNNAGTINQSQSQKEHSNNTDSADQSQNINTSPQGGCHQVSVVQCPNQAASIQQNDANSPPTSTGKNDIKLGQTIDQSQDTNTTSGQQTQSSPSGGQDGHIDQYSQGVSTSRSDQDEKQNQHANPQGFVFQSQYGPHACCSEQLDNLDNSFTIVQDTNQVANSVFFDQENQSDANCDSSGECHVTQTVHNDGGESKNSEDAPIVHTTTDCFFAGGVGGAAPNPQASGGPNSNGCTSFDNGGGGLPA